MPDFKDLLRQNEKYGRGALAFMLEKARMDAFAIISTAMSDEEKEEFFDKFQQYEDMMDQFDAEERYVSKNGYETFDKKMPPEADKFGMELLEFITNKVKQKRDEMEKNNDPFLPIYDYALQTCSKEGNLMEARMESQYLYGLNQSGSFPDVSKDHEMLKNALLGDKDEMTGEYKGPLYPLMDYYKSYIELEKVEFTRQKNEREGWTAEKEQVFLADLKKKQQNVIDKFEKLYNLEDKYQGNNGVLNNDLAHITGKGDNRRSAYPAVNVLRGQIKAIENGWSHDELTVLGAVGLLGAVYEQTKIDFEELYERSKNTLETHKHDWNKLEGVALEAYLDAQKAVENEAKNREKMSAYEKDLNELKEKVWNKKINTPEDKLEVLIQVKSFITDHKNIRLEGMVHKWTDLSAKLDLSSAEPFVDNVLTRDPLSKNNSLFKGLHNAMEDSKKGVHGGTAEYNRIVTDVAALGIKVNKFKDNKKAMNDPKTKEAYEKIIAALDKYLNRKNNEIEGAKAKNKEPNANSVMRKNTMEMVRRELRHAFEGKPLKAEAVLDAAQQDGLEVNVNEVPQNAVEVNAAQPNAQAVIGANVEAQAAPKAPEKKAPAKEKGAAKSFKKYIMLHTGENMGKTADEMIINASKCIAAGILNSTGDKFSVSDIHRTAEVVRETYSLDAFKNNPEKLRELLHDTNSVVSMGNQLRDTIYGVKPEKTDKYFDDLKALADNLPKTEGHGKQYAELNKLIKEAAAVKNQNLSPDQLKVSIRKYNSKIYSAALKYIDSKGIKNIDVEKNPRAATALNAIAVLTNSTEGLNYRTTKLVVDLRKSLNSRHSKAAENFMDTAKFTQKYGAANVEMQKEPVKKSANKQKKPVTVKTN